MYMFKKQIIVGLALCVASSAYGKHEHKRNSLRRSTVDLAETTAKHAHGALCSAAQGLDHLFYPGLCALLGYAALNTTAAQKLPHAPKGYVRLENKVPGARLTRTTVTYVAAGGLLCAALNYLSNIERVNEFLGSNMPHLSALLQHIKTELSYGTSTTRCKTVAAAHVHRVR